LGDFGMPSSIRYVRLQLAIPVPALNAMSTAEGDCELREGAWAMNI
jgi:hypothetical protein